METALRTVNALISALFFICYAYQFLYIPLVPVSYTHLTLPTIA